MRSSKSTFLSPVSRRAEAANGQQLHRERAMARSLMGRRIKRRHIPIGVGPSYADTALGQTSIMLGSEARTSCLQPDTGKPLSGLHKQLLVANRHGAQERTEEGQNRGRGRKAESQAWEGQERRDVRSHELFGCLLSIYHDVYMCCRFGLCMLHASGSNMRRAASCKLARRQPEPVAGASMLLRGLR